MLVGDKGYMKDEEMAGDRDPHIAYHGSLSCMVSPGIGYGSSPSLEFMAFWHAWTTRLVYCVC